MTSTMSYLLESFQECRKRGEFAQLFLETRNHLQFATFRVQLPTFDTPAKRRVEPTKKHKSPSRRLRDQSRLRKFQEKVSSFQNTTSTPKEHSNLNHDDSSPVNDLDNTDPNNKIIEAEKSKEVIILDIEIENPEYNSISKHYTVEKSGNHNDKDSILNENSTDNRKDLSEGTFVNETSTNAKVKTTIDLEIMKSILGQCFFRKRST